MMEVGDMEITYPRCSGLDVHKRSVTACRLLPGPGLEPVKEVRTFATMTADLLALADWLAEAGVTHVAMESTGVYWQPVWNLLEERFRLLLVNPAHMKAVPGRKTDVADAEWLADLLRHGLLAPSLVPDRAQRELRELTRYRSTLVHNRADEVNRLHKTLEGANIKLASVVSDISRGSARAMVEELLRGNADHAAIAQLAYGAMRRKLPQLEAALQGTLTPHQCFMLQQHFVAIDALDAQMATVQARLDAVLAPQEMAASTLLVTVPGISTRLATILIAEIGTDMHAFPSAAHLASWAGMCPGQHESAGKQRSGRTRKGNVWLRTALVEAAHAAGRTKNTALGQRFRRLTARRGKRKAAMAVGRQILEICYHLLSTGESYQDQRVQPHNWPAARPHVQRLVRQLEQLGHVVTLAPAVPWSFS
jgi:transposase